MSGDWIKARSLRKAGKQITGVQHLIFLLKIAEKYTVQANKSRFGNAERESFAYTMTGYGIDDRLDRDLDEVVDKAIALIRIDNG